MPPCTLAVAFLDSIFFAMEGGRFRLLHILVISRDTVSHATSVLSSFPASFLANSMTSWEKFLPQTSPYLAIPNDQFWLDVENRQKMQMVNRFLIQPSF